MDGTFDKHFATMHTFIKDEESCNEESLALLPQSEMVASTNPSPVPDKVTDPPSPIAQPEHATDQPIVEAKEEVTEEETVKPERVANYLFVETKEMVVKMETTKPSAGSTSESRTNTACIEARPFNSPVCLELDDARMSSVTTSTPLEPNTKSNTGNDSSGMFVEGPIDFESDDDIESSDNECSEFEPEDGNDTEEEQASSVPEATTPHTQPKEPRERRKPAKNAREYCARELEKMGLDPATKALAAKKSLKKSNQGNGHGSDPINAVLGTSLHDMAVSDAPAMAKFSANTVAAQTAAYKASLPADYDLRRGKTQINDLNEARRVLGNRRVKAEGPDFRVKSMQLTIKPYQLTAIAWMLKRERMYIPEGGIVADVMGMGKTVVSLTCISENMPEAKDVKEFCHATLVVVPNNRTAAQWYSEVKKHCTKKVEKTVRIYSNDVKVPIKDYKKSAIVITTYHELLARFPAKSEIDAAVAKHGGDEDAVIKAINITRNNLFAVKWYRVILDEAHVIKNRNSNTSYACSSLLAKYRWALSGTPLANSATEFYPYLRFLKCPRTANFSEFKAEYISQGKAAPKLVANISALMYRRTMKDEFLGNKILDIPESHFNIVWTPLSEEERCFDEAVQRFYGGDSESEENKEGKANAEDMDEPGMRSGTEECDDDDEDKRKDKNTSSHNGSAKWMRRRQAVSHPFTLKKMIRRDLQPKDLENLLKSLEDNGGKLNVIDQIHEKIADPATIAPYTKGIEELKKHINTKPVFGGKFSMKALLSMVQDEHKIRSLTCKLCNKARPPAKPMQSSLCGHVYCELCLMKAASGKSLKRSRGKQDENIVTTVMKTQVGLQDHANEAKCPFDGCGVKLWAGEEVRTLPCIMAECKDDGEFKEPGEDANGVILVRNEEENSFLCAVSNCGLDDALPPSSKLTVALAVILTWLEEHPEDKIIVFSQFVMTGKVLGCMLGLLQKKFVYLYGTMSDGQRKNALDHFENKPEVKVLVSSLLCGGQSLNLAHANRVILIDPWWNTTREEQAWGRVLRIGQKKKSHFVKIMTQKTIDDRVSQLQIFKEREIRHVLQDDGHTPQQLDDDQLQEMCVPRVQGKQGKKNCREHFPKCGAPRALKKRKHSDTAE